MINLKKISSMNTVQKSIAVSALLSNLSLVQVEALALQTKSKAGEKYFSLDDFGDEESEESEEQDTTPSVYTPATVSGTNGSNGRKRCRCSDSNWGCQKPSCCPCDEEFEEVFCCLEDLKHKVCDIEIYIEDQNGCIGELKGEVGETLEKVCDIQLTVNEILEEIGNIEPGTPPGGGNGDGKGCLVCINCGGSGCCCCNGDGENGDCGCCCCCDCEPEPPIGTPGGPDEPDDVCLIFGGDNGLENEDIVEFWFSAQTKSCTRDYYLGSSSINWRSNNGDFTCDDITGFHGEAMPGAEVSQAAFYAKRNSHIPGLYETTTWEYSTTVIDDINADQTDPALIFDGAQLIDFQGLCLTFPELPTQDDQGND